MGRVYTPEQVEQDRIPELGAQIKAGRFILDAISFNADSLQGSLNSGMIYGSTATGTPDIRSDLDVLAIYHNGRTALPFLRKLFSEAEDTYNVSVEAAVYPAGSLYTPSLHTIDPLFARHLLEVQGMEDPVWSHNWPVDALRQIAYSHLSEEYLRRLAGAYISGKARQLTRASVNYRGEADTHDMQRALELPAAIGRKILPIFMDEENIPRIEDKKGTVSSVLRVTNEQMIYAEYVLSDFHKLLEINREYDQMLAQVVKSQITIGAYKDWLNENYLPAIESGIAFTNAWANHAVTRHYSVAEFKEVERAQQERYELELDEWLKKNAGKTTFDFEVYMLGVY